MTMKVETFGDGGIIITHPDRATLALMVLSHRMEFCVRFGGSQKERTYLARCAKHWLGMDQKIRQPFNKLYQLVMNKMENNHDNQNQQA